MKDGGECQRMNYQQKSIHGVRPHGETGETGLPTGDLCCGCGVCCVSCPTGAISMMPDCEGFLRPVVDQKKCIHCGRCVSTCPSLKEERSRVPLEVFRVHAKDDDVRWGSASGGLFALLARAALDRGGVVFGAAYEHGSWRVVHKRADTYEELEELRGSKYVQSDIGKCFLDVRACLAEGKNVLFSGCPCQIAALRCFLGKDDPNLLLVDLICHGVPSPTAWQAFLSDEESCHHHHLVSVAGRKNCKWNDFGMSLGFSDGSRLSFVGAFRQNPYMAAYLNRWMNRRSCYRCRFRQFKSGSDLTIGDDWSYYPVSNEHDRTYGISCVFSNTEKGYSALKTIAEHSVVTAIDYDQAVCANLAVLKDDEMPKVRETFYDLIRERGFLNAVDELLPKRDRPLLVHLAWWLKRLIVNHELNRF